jgi:hypothetical protein
MAGSKTKAGKVFRVTRSHDAFNEGELYRTAEDDWMKGRVAAGYFREVEGDELEQFVQRGDEIREVDDIAGPAVVDTAPQQQGAASDAVEGSDAPRP